MVDPSIDGHGLCVIDDPACNPKMHGSWHAVQMTELPLKNDYSISSATTSHNQYLSKGTQQTTQRQQNTSKKTSDVGKVKGNGFWGNGIRGKRF